MKQLKVDDAGKHPEDDGPLDRRGVRVASGTAVQGARCFGHHGRNPVNQTLRCRQVGVKWIILKPHSMNGPWERTVDRGVKRLILGNNLGQRVEDAVHFPAPAHLFQKFGFERPHVRLRPGVSIANPKCLRDHRCAIRESLLKEVKVAYLVLGQTQISLVYECGVEITCH
jgi:hypothetical protein